MSSERDHLFRAYLEGSITPAEMERLNSLLKSDVEARRELAEQLNLDSALAALAAGWMDEQMPRARPVIVTMARRWIAAAACVALAAVSWWWASSQQTMAVVDHASGAGQWAAGMTLHRDWHHLEAGTLSLTSERGAQLTIEAPAEFRFESPQRLRLKQGRLAADVPPAATGFTVVTPSGDAVDLGTRFGVDVPPSGPAEVHVFQGEVITQASGGAKQSLKGGDAVVMNAGTSMARDIRSAAFIQADEMREMTAAIEMGQRARSDAALSSLKQDPALIALLDFEQDDQSLRSGSFRRMQGRWPGTHAPEFSRMGDHLKLDVGGDRSWPELTLAAWVRLDRVGEPYQSLLHTDGWESSNPGQVHWMVTRHATMRLALRGNTLPLSSDEPEGHPDSRTPVLAEQGRWMHLAVSYDAASGLVRFYLNGVLDKTGRQEKAYPARLGPAQIGNWNRTDRRLSGRVDELLILGRVMQEGEVRELFEAGNPYR